eukprot:Gb_29951 [translate_table: standard]
MTVRAFLLPATLLQQSTALQLPFIDTTSLQKCLHLASRTSFATSPLHLWRLPSDYLAQLPNDLCLDLNDVAFDLSSKLVDQECSEQFGEILMKLSQTWEKADTHAIIEVASVLPSLEVSLSDDIKRALGKCFKCVGRHFASTGEYGQGELQKIAKAMVAVGEALVAGSSSSSPLDIHKQQN